MLRTTLEGDTMAHDDAARAYEDLTFSMSDDEDFDVAVAADGLLVRGKLFAFLEGDDLVVELPEVRAKDLKARGVARLIQRLLGEYIHAIFIVAAEHESIISRDENFNPRGR